MIMNETLKSATTQITVKDETFVPILELCYMALEDIFGKDIEEGCNQMVEVFNDNNAIGVVTTYFDSRIGFTLNFEKGWKEFEISVDGERMKIDQLQLFDKLRKWGYKI